MAKRPPRKIVSGPKKDRVVRVDRADALAVVRGRRETPRLIDEVNRQLVMSQSGELYDRDNGMIHVSEVVKNDWCPRSTAYRILSPKLGEYEPNSAFLTRIYERGNEIHHRWQEWFWDIGGLRGTFLCLGCTHTWAGKSPHACPECDLPRWGLRYEEVQIRVEDLLLVGHADGDVDLDGLQRCLIEIKSLGNGTYRFENPGLYYKFQKGEVSAEAMWRSTTSALPSHLRQGLLYLCLVDDPEINEIRFIYEWKANGDVKEFTVKRADVRVQDLVADINDLADAVVDEELPDRPQWSDKKDKVCKKCPYLKSCWK